MEFTIEQFQEAASKVLHLDASHSALRDKLQSHVSTEHRKAIANSGQDTGYYDTPYVHDVFGSEDAGKVVTSHKGQMNVQKFSKFGDGYKLFDKKKVKQAYVTDNDADDKKESFTVIIDGKDVEMHEAATALSEVGEILELQESAKGGNSRVKVTLISAGKGSSGYYTEAALKKAAADKVFDAGTRMFLNHQTAQERRERPEGDAAKWMGTTKNPAEYIPGDGSTPGRLIAEADVYPEFKEFVKARKDDLGVSVRVGAQPSGKTQEGVPLVENMVYALSADFVTKAGRGGRIEEMYESYRAVHPPVQESASGNQPQEKEMTDQEKQQFAALETKLSRLQESNARLRAGSLLSESLGNSGLKPRGQDRVKKQALAALPLTADGDLDETKFQESVKEIVKDELAYLQESGIDHRTPVVRYQGVVPETKDNGEEVQEAEVLANSEKVLQESVAVLANRGGK